MYAQFLASYLYENNYLNKKQLIEALKLMDKSRVKLGVMAINAGYMTYEQVEKVHARQTKVDKRMGDIAVDMGYMTAEQVEELLSQQPSRHLLLSQTIVDRDYIDTKSFAQALNEFKAEYNLTDDDMKNANEDKLEKVIEKYYNLSDSNNIKVRYIKLLYSNLVRFIGNDFIPALVKKDIIQDSVTVAQEISGQYSFNTMLYTDEISFIQFASRFAKQEIPVLDEYSTAAGEDFMNLHNGLFIVGISNDDEIELNLAPPITNINENVSYENYIIAQMMFSFGEIKFGIQR